MFDADTSSSISRLTKHDGAAKTFSARNVLVTGGLGFLGLNLVRVLVAAGAHVRILSRSWIPHDPESELLLQSVDLFKGDIRDEAVVDEAVSGVEFAFHCAGKSGPAASNASPTEDLDVNVRGTLVFLDACRRHARDVKIVFPSSRLVYAPDLAGPVPETAPTVPVSAYGVHKLTTERHLLLYERLHGLRATILRMSNPYGPFQRPEQNRYGILNWFIYRAVHNQPLSVYGSGSQLRDYVHVDDVVRAMLLAASSPSVDGQVINVGSGTGVSFRHMAEMVVAANGAGTIVEVPWPETARLVETGNFVFDIARAHDVLKWAPSIPLDVGIERVVAHYRRIATAAS